MHVCSYVAMCVCRNNFYMIYNMTYNKWTTYNTTLLQAKLSCKHAYVYAETLTTSEHWTTYNTTLLQAKLSCKHAYVYAETLTTSEHWTITTQPCCKPNY